MYFKDNNGYVIGPIESFEIVRTTGSSIDLKYSKEKPQSKPTTNQEEAPVKCILGHQKLNDNNTYYITKFKDNSVHLLPYENFNSKIVDNYRNRTGLAPQTKRKKLSK